MPQNANILYAIFLGLFRLRRTHRLTVSRKLRQCAKTAIRCLAIPGRRPIHSNSPGVRHGLCPTAQKSRPSSPCLRLRKTHCKARAIGLLLAGMRCEAFLKESARRRRRFQLPCRPALLSWPSSLSPAASARPAWWQHWAGLFRRAASGFCLSIPHPMVCCRSSSARAISVPGCSEPSALQAIAAMRPSRW